MGLEIIYALVTEGNKQEYLSSCKKNTLVYYVASDFEIPFPDGYAVQMSATRNNSFAMFYPSCNVSKVNNFCAKENFEYDFSFIGDIRPSIRPLLFKKMDNYFQYRKHLKTKFILNDKQFSMFSQETKKQMNEENDYDGIMKNTKFALCPRGSGLQSIRFFEALAANVIPIYIGDKETKFPLDWLIDWDKVCFRVKCENIINGFFQADFDKFLKLSNNEINDRRKYIFDIYNTFFTDENVFKELIYDKVKDLLCRN